MQVNDRKIKENDVFRFRYNSNGFYGFDPRTHCFEGLLIAVYDTDHDELYFHDTYWGINNKFQARRTLAVSEAEREGTLDFKFNLNDVEPIREGESGYYKEEDIFVITEQHASIKNYYRRKGSLRDQETMIINARKLIDKNEFEISYLEEENEVFKRMIDEYESGCLNSGF